VGTVIAPNGISVSALVETGLETGALHIIEQNRPTADPEKGPRFGNATTKAELTANNLRRGVVEVVIADGTPRVVEKDLHCALQ
jgi:hypothetical protein